MRFKNAGAIGTIPYICICCIACSTTEWFEMKEIFLQVVPHRDLSSQLIFLIIFVIKKKKKEGWKQKE